MSNAAPEPDCVVEGSVASADAISQGLMDAVFFPQVSANVPIDEPPQTPPPVELRGNPEIEPPPVRRSMHRRHGPGGLQSGITRFIRSGTVRAILSCAGVLLIIGLIGMNYHRPTKSLSIDDELADLELAGLDSGTGAKSAAMPESAFKDGLSLAPFESSGGRFDQAAANGQRGAWLTGQIEFDSSSVLPAGYSAAGPTRVTPQSTRGRSSFWSR